MKEVCLTIEYHGFFSRGHADGKYQCRYVFYTFIVFAIMVSLNMYLPVI